MSKILLFGDSNTWGYKSFGEGRYNDDERYSFQLKKKGYDVVENGVCGRTTIFADPREGKVGIMDLDSVINPSYDYIAVMLGSNDFKSKNAVNKETLLYALNTFYDKLDSLNKKSKVILISPPHLSSMIEDFDYEYSYDSYLISLKAAEIYESFAKSRGYLFLDAARYTKFGPDGCHITLDSHKKLGEAITRLIK